MDHDYFPLVAGASRTYECQFSGKTESKTLVTHAHRLGGAVVYFAVEANEAQDGNQFIFPHLPGLGAYVRTREGICTVDCAWTDDITYAAVAERQPMLTFPLVRGAVSKVKYVDGDCLRIFTVGDFEEVAVPAGKFTRCARLDITERWKSGEKYRDTVWLAPDIGVVRWHRSTGRMEELSSF